MTPVHVKVAVVVALFWLNGQPKVAGKFGSAPGKLSCNTSVPTLLGVGVEVPPCLLTIAAAAPAAAAPAATVVTTPAPAPAAPVPAPES